MSIPSTHTLERGKACLRCRRRKMRCDGTRPICGQCAKAEINQDCEYTDAGPTTSQILERNIADLEARIAELMKGPSTDSVTLKRPYTEKRTARESPARINSPATLNRSASSSVAGHSASMLSPTYESPEKFAPSSVILDIIPKPTSPGFLESFLTVAQRLDFFLHIPRFMLNIKMSIPPTHEAPIPPALVYAVLLLDCLFGNGQHRKPVQNHLLTLSLENLATPMEPNKIIYFLQAEVIISHYLCHQNQRLAASYHISAAVSIAVACNLHKIRSARAVTSTSPPITLPPPADTIEEGERIRAFWITYILDRGWTVWTHSSSPLLDESSSLSQIDTPWPKDLQEYEHDLIFPITLGQQTVLNFLKSPDATAAQLGQSILSLRAKSTIFFEKAVRLSVSRENEYPTPQSDFEELDLRIQQWALALPPLSIVPANRQDIVRGLLTVKTMCCCSMILIHSSLNPEAPLNDRVASAAQEAVALVQEVDLLALRVVDTVVGILWGIVGKTLIACIRASGREWTARHDPGVMMSCLHELMTALQLFGKDSPLLHHEWSRLQVKLAEP